MNTAIILAGGTGTRIGGDVPKQYLQVGNKPIITYCLEKFERNKNIDEIVIVAAVEWQKFITENMDGIEKFKCFAPAGKSRQHSIVNGLKASSSNTINVIIHDAARPNVTDEIINQCMLGLDEYDGVMPVLPVKDTIYYSESGNQISSLLNRDCLFAGQAPESFRYLKYLSIHNGMTDEELGSVRGSSEIAYRNGLRVKLIEGDEQNYKITTTVELEKFRSEVKQDAGV